MFLFFFISEMLPIFVPNMEYDSSEFLFSLTDAVTDENGLNCMEFKMRETIMCSNCKNISFAEVIKRVSIFLLHFY